MTSSTNPANPTPRERRAALGLSQRTVSIEADVDQSAVSRFERGQPTQKQTRRVILDALDRLEAQNDETPAEAGVTR